MLYFYCVDGYFWSINGPASGHFTVIFTLFFARILGLEPPSRLFCWCRYWFSDQVNLTLHSSRKGFLIWSTAGFCGFSWEGNAGSVFSLLLRCFWCDRCLCRWVVSSWGCGGARGVNPGDRLQYMHNIFFVSIPGIHNFCASSVTFSRNCVGKSFSVTTSTEIPYSSSMDCCKPVKSSNVAPLGAFTKRSRSLPSWSSPWIVDPKTRMFVSPKCCASLRMSCRCLLTIGPAPQSCNGLKVFVITHQDRSAFYGMRGNPHIIDGKWGVGLF